MVFVEDPWSRIVAVHWEADPDEPPDPDDPQPYSCGTWHWHFGDDDAYIEKTQDGVTTRYPFDHNIWPMYLTPTGVAFGPFNPTPPKEYNLFATNVVNISIQYTSFFTVVHTPFPQSFPIFIWTQTAGWGSVWPSAPHGPNQWPPEPAEMDYVFYSFTGSYPNEQVTDTFEFDTRPPGPGAILLYLMGTSTQAITGTYQDWYNYYYGGVPGAPPFTPPGGFDSNVPQFTNSDIFITLTCQQPTPPPPGR